MQKRAGLLTVFLLFIAVSLIIFFLFRLPIMSFTSGFFDNLLTPVQRSFYGAFGGFRSSSKEITDLREQNRVLASKIVDQRALQKEADALRDQYDAEDVSSKELLPARVIGMNTFIPGRSLPEEIILDKGSNQHVSIGQSVIVSSNVVGQVTNVTENRSLVTLVSNKKQSITAKAVKTNALGIIRGNGNGGLVLGNVVLSDTLEKGDLIVTKGEVDISGIGYPPDLVIGKIVSIDKKASNLFQTAEIESLVDFSRLTTVFIMLSSK